MPSTMSAPLERDDRDQREAAGTGVASAAASIFDDESDDSAPRRTLASTSTHTTWRPPSSRTSARDRADPVTPGAQRPTRRRHARP